MVVYKISTEVQEFIAGAPRKIKGDIVSHPSLHFLAHECPLREEDMPVEGIVHPRVDHREEAPVRCVHTNGIGLFILIVAVKKRSGHVVQDIVAVEAEGKN